MPTFKEHVGQNRDLRVLASYAPPLPNAQFTKVRPEDGRYDVVIVGAGPAGLFLTLLLARYGLSDSSVLCIDQKPGILLTGQADGIQPRTIEVLQSLDLAHEMLIEGCHLWEVGFWNPTADGGIARTSYAPDVVAATRYPHELTIHQGRIERILTEDLAKYSERGVQYDTRFVSFRMDAAGDPEYPVEIVTESTLGPESERASSRRTIRAKHIIASDGARSSVRRSAGLSLVGESKDHIWGVVDFVCDTDFPDIRRRCPIHSASGSAMTIPRERISTGEYLTRLYIQMDDVNPEAKEDSRLRREKVTLETIFEHAQQVFKPYKLEMAKGTEPDWWAAYQIGQRLTSAFTVQDEDGIPRVFVVGDAAHTHSPKAGQGMNVSLMDSYNLGWKLAYHLLGLCPPSQGVELLLTYASERKQVAEQLIEFDTKFSGMFSGKVGASSTDNDNEPLTHEKFLEVFSKASGFSSGCGLEYANSCAVTHLPEEAESKWPGWPASKAEDLLMGMLWPGRRLMNARVIRHADGSPRELQDASALSESALLIESAAPKLLELVVLHPLAGIRGCEYSSLPSAVYKHAEMNFFSGTSEETPYGKSGQHQWRAEDAYKIFGVDKEKGRIALVRPDGYVAAMGELDEVERIRSVLWNSILVTEHQKNGA